MTSDGSTNASHNDQDNPEATRHAYDSIEAEIDELKEEVSRLREEANKGRAEAEVMTKEERAIDKFLSTRSGQKVPLTTTTVEESPAMRLQRQHEAQLSESMAPVEEKPDSPVPPSPLDFPTLGQTKVGVTVASPTGSDGEARRHSYARAATSGMNAAAQTISQNGNVRRDSRISDSISNDKASGNSFALTSTFSKTQTSSAAPFRDSDEAKDDERSVIVSSQHRTAEVLHDEPAKASKKKPSTQDKKVMRQSPHFAQPTQSFARRAGETLRKDAVSASPKSPVESSPTRSIKATEPKLETTKRLTQRKRKSIPLDWLNTSGQSRDLTVSSLNVNVGKATGDITSSSTNKVVSSKVVPRPKVDDPSSLEKSAEAKIARKEMSPQSALRKKASSYMAPTTAATQRTIATLGTEKSKPEPARVKTDEKRLDAPLTSHIINPLSPRSKSVASDNSSVQFILEQPPKEANGSPSRSGEKHRRYGALRRRNHAQGEISIPTASPGSSRPRKQSRSPAKGSEASEYVERRLQQTHVRSDSRSSDVLTPLPEVANTTTKRRTSHGHLLGPIFACLQSKGLLNQSSTKSAAYEAYVQSTAKGSSSEAQQAVSENRFGPLGTRSQAHSSASHDDKGSFPGSKSVPTGRVLPPHLRISRQTSATSTSTETTLCQEQMTTGPTTSRVREHVDSLLPQQGLAISNAGRIIEESLPPLVKSSTTPSLRATAEEFIPIRPLVDDMALRDSGSVMRYFPMEEWTNMSPEMRKQIVETREMNRPFRWLPNRPSNLQHMMPGPPFRHLTQYFGAGHHPQLSRMMAPINFVDENGSPHLVQAGQTLRPSLEPGKKGVQWMLQDLDGKETPIKFGRASAPPYEPLTPSVTSASADTTPLKTPHSVQRWHIGSAFSLAPYGWTGGDGKEIRFVGHGPYAERNPNNTINFDFHGRTSSLGANVRDRFVEDKENFPSSEQVAPKSQRQWAEKLRYTKVPCGNVEITQAVEHIAFGSQLADYCHKCVPK